MRQSKRKRILVAPLDWGIGHASRCIPVIEKLLERHAEVIIAADRRPLLLLRQEFPNLEFITLGGMNVKYPKRLPMSLYMALKAPRFLQSIDFEHQMLKKIVKNYQIDGVISDNRYGLHHTKVPAVLMTHQLFIQTPLFKNALVQITNRLIRPFNQCWIPDFEGELNLSGDLSHQKSSLSNLIFVGPISRFQKLKNKHSIKVFKQRFIAVLSGPEPSRTTFEKILVPQLEALDEEVLIVQGLIGDNQHTSHPNKGKLKFINHLAAQDLHQEIQDSEMVICRAGYSSIMDLASINKNALLVPTPGQTEQEYLAKHLRELGLFHSAKEKGLNLKKELEIAKTFNKKFESDENSKLDSAIDSFLDLINHNSFYSGG